MCTAPAPTVGICRCTRRWHRHGFQYFITIFIMVDLCFLKFTRHGRQLLPSPALIRNCNDREQLQESLIRAFDASKSILCISLEWVVEFTLGETTAFVPFVPDVVTEIANLIQQPDNEVFYTKNVNLSEDERSITIEVPIWWNSEGYVSAHSVMNGS